VRRTTPPRSFAVKSRLLPRQAGGGLRLPLTAVEEDIAMPPNQVLVTSLSWKFSINEDPKAAKLIARLDKLNQQMAAAGYQLIVAVYKNTGNLALIKPSVETIANNPDKAGLASLSVSRFIIDRINLGTPADFPHAGEA
jgi:hypothetical protein